MGAFTGQTAFITGAGNGIGRQMALSLAKEGAAIAAVDLKPEGLQSLGTELAGSRYAWAIGDVTDRPSLLKGVAAVTASVGPIDLLIANAGIGIENSALDFRAEDFEAQIRVNLIGVANSVAAVLDGMIQRRRGHLVALSSLASYRGLPKMLGYCSSKAGVSSLMEGLRIELAPLGIHVTTICPGWIRTALTATIEIPKPFMMEVDYAVGKMVDAIRKKKQHLAFPVSAANQMRLLKWLPCSLSDWMTRRAVRFYDK